jgi:hypothetical protein
MGCCNLIHCSRGNHTTGVAMVKDFSGKIKK